MSNQGAGTEGYDWIYDNQDLTEMNQELGLNGPPVDPFKPATLGLLDGMITLWKRVKAVEKALDEIHPAWRYGGHFHCSCAACSD